MTPEGKAALAALRAGGSAGGHKLTNLRAGAPSATEDKRSFATLPLSRQVALAKATGAALSMASPFFRVITEVAGPKVRIDGTWVTNFASYDYLGLNQHPDVITAASAAMARSGVSATASRLVGGNHDYHIELERALAAFLQAEDAITLVSGHATNLAILRTLLGPGDLVAVDQFAHNSLFEGIRSSGAAHLTFPHNDWRWLDQRLAERTETKGRLIVAIEGLYSMDGDMPDLAAFAEVTRRHEGWLMVDEAHSIGTLGATGKGICEAQGVTFDLVDIRMGTLSKALCSAGGFVTGKRELIDLLRYGAPGFLYSVGLSAPNAAASLAALRLMQGDPARIARLQALGARFQAKAQALGLATGLAQGHAIGCVMIGDSLRAVSASAQLLAKGFNVLPILAPAVPDKAARLRFFLTAEHSPDDIDRVLESTAACIAEARARRF